MVRKKDIKDMSLEELKKEIKEYPCQKDRRYVFVSYSHLDAEIVYRQVLSWLREGYNIYIDMDFENHGSEVNWINIMEDCVRKRACSMAVCFKSGNYICSYAALIELLTMRSEETRKNRKNVNAEHDRIPIDIISLKGGTDVPNFLDNDELMDRYAEYYKSLKEKMGKTFAEKNKPEGEKLQKCLIDWIDSVNSEAYKEITERTGIERFETIVNNYNMGNTGDFYAAIARCVLDWFASTDLNGNTKELFSDGVMARFQDLKIYKKEVSANSSDNHASSADNESDTSTSLERSEKSAEMSEVKAEKRKPGRPKSDKTNANGKSEKAGQLQKSKPANGALKDLFDKNKISVGMEIYIAGYPNSEAVIVEADKVQYKGNKRTLKEYIDFASGMKLTKQEPLSVIFEKNSGRSLQELLSDEITAEEEPAAMNKELPEKSVGKKKEGKKRTEEKVEFTPEEVTPVEKTPEGDITIGEVRTRLSNDMDFLIKLTDIRQKGLPFGGKSYMDYAMAAILNGCNNLKEDYQFNYYRYAIANRDNKKESAKTEATWTWSSNARKVVGYVSTGMLPVQINNCFAELPDSTTVNDLIRKFEACEEEAFITKKNNMVIFCLQKFIEGYHE